MAGMLRVSRSRGAFSGMLLLLLGAWGGLIPFVGPYFNYAYTPDSPWTYTTGRLWLEIIPGAAVFLGGLILMAARLRPVAQFGAVLAVLGGIWFAVGGILSTMWASTFSYSAGVPVGGTVLRALEQIGFFYGLGVIIVLFAAMALGRLSIVAVRDARLAEADEEVNELPPPVPVGAESDRDDAETKGVPYPRRSPSVPPG